MKKKAILFRLPNIPQLVMGMKAVEKIFLRKMMAGDKSPGMSFHLLLAAAAGILLRVWLTANSGWRMDYDEGMIGLLGLRLLQGELHFFVPAQPTLGTVEPFLLAPILGLLPPTNSAFRLLSFALAAGYILTIGWLGRAAFDERVGVIAGWLAAICPPYMIIASLKTWGSTIETILLGNLLLILTLKLVVLPDYAKRRWLFFSWGFIAGVMFWLAWLGFYYILPAFALLLWQKRGRLKRNWRHMLAGFLIGSFPFWLFNLQNDFATFRVITSGARGDLWGALPQIATDFMTALLPRLVTFDAHWIDGETSSWFVWGMLGLYLAGIVALLLQTKKQFVRWLVALFLICLSTLYFFSGYGKNALNPWGIDAAGRYVVMLHSVLPLGGAFAAHQLIRHPNLGARFGGWIFLGALFAGNLWGIFQLNPIKAFNSPYYDRLPVSLQPIIDYLEAADIRYVWTDAGIAHLLMFQSNQRIIAADYYDAYIANGQIRFPDALAQVVQAENTAIITPILPEQTDLPLQRVMDALEIRYDFVRIQPDIAIYIPHERLDLSRISGGLGPQYFATGE